MKKTLSFLFVAAMLASTPAMAQTYTIKGTAPKDATFAYLKNLESERDAAPDSVAVSDGKFEFAGEADGKLFARLSTNSKEKADAAVGVVLEGDVQADLTTETVGGTPENDGLNTWTKRIDLALKDRYAALEKMVEPYKDAKSADEIPEDVLEKVATEYQSIRDVRQNLLIMLGDGNLTSRFPAYHLYQDAYVNLDRAKVIGWKEKDAAFMQTSLMERTNKAIEGWKNTMEGAPVADLEEADTAGVMHKLSEYVGKGNYVLVDFWASWCGPCMAELPNVKAAYDKYHAKGFEVVGLSFDNNKKAWTGAIERMQMNWIHLSDLKGWSTVASSTYGVNSIPYTLLYDGDGKVVAAKLRGEELQAKLKEIYGF